MRAMTLLGIATALAGCVPTADFTLLREEVRDVQAENQRLKQRFEAQGQQPAVLGKRVEALEKSVDEMKARQRGLDQKVADLIRQLDETSRQLDSLNTRLEEGGSGGRADTREPVRDLRTEAPGVKAGKPNSVDTTAGLSQTSVYNLAYNYYLKGSYDLAIAEFENFLRQFPTTSLAAHALYWIGESYYSKKEYRSAIDAYDRLIANHPKSDKVPAALYKIGAAYADQGDAAKARSFFKRVLEEHPQSDEANRARQRLADLR